MQYCAASSPLYAARATALLAADWPAEAIAAMQRLANHYNVISGFYLECARTDPASPRMLDLQRQFAALVAQELAMEGDAAAALGWTACNRGPPPCYP